MDSIENDNSVIENYFTTERERLHSLLGEVLFPHFESDAPLQVISIGCGVGFETQPVISLFPNASFVGVDIDPGFIKMAQTFNKDVVQENRVSFVNADALHKDVYADHSWDVVILRNPQLFGSFERMEQKSLAGRIDMDPVWEKIVDNAVNVLSEKGIIVASTATKDERDVLVEKLKGFGNLVVSDVDTKPGKNPVLLGDQFLLTATKSTQEIN